MTDVSIPSDQEPTPPAQDPQLSPIKRGRGRPPNPKTDNQEPHRPRGRPKGSTTVRGKVVAKASVAPAGATDKDPEIKTGYDLPPQTFSADEQYSKVGINVGMTRSLGDMEFARVDVYVEDFCAADKKPEALESAHKVASDYLRRILKDIDGFLAEKRRRDAQLAAELNKIMPQGGGA